MVSVIQLVNSLKTGGAETLVKDYSIYIDKEKFNVAVLASYETGNSANLVQLKEKNIKVVYLNKWIPNFLLRRTTGLIRRNLEFRRYLKDNNVDVIHGHLDSNKYFIINLDKLKNIKLLYTVHNEPAVVFGGSFAKKINLYMTKFLVKHKNMQLIALHEEMRKELNQLFEINNTVVVNNAIDLSRFQRNLHKDKFAEIRLNINLNKDDFVVGHVGRFNKQKNHKFLVEVFVRLLKEKPNAKLLLIGSGELKPDVIKQIKDNNIEDKVVMLENRRDIPELMSVMDVFLFPSIFEGLGIVLVEAQSIGLKCVASSVVPKAVHLKENLIYLDLNESVDKWCDAILDNNIKTSPKASLSDYDMNIIIKELENLYIN